MSVYSRLQMSSDSCGDYDPVPARPASCRSDGCFRFAECRPAVDDRSVSRMAASDVSHCREHHSGCDAHSMRRVKAVWLTIVLVCLALALNSGCGGGAGIGGIGGGIGNGGGATGGLTSGSGSGAAAATGIDSGSVSGGGIAAGTGGGSGGSGNVGSGSGISVVTFPPLVMRMSVNGHITFTATVTGATPATSGVTWSVKGGPACGTVTQTGVYTAPAAGGLYHVVATSIADNTKSGSSSIAVGQRIVY